MAKRMKRKRNEELAGKMNNYRLWSYLRDSTLKYGPMVDTLNTI